MHTYKLQKWPNFCQRDDGVLVGWDTQEYIDFLASGGAPLPADPEPVIPYTVLREAAYKLDADPLFYQEQRGEVPAGTWAAKVAEIKLRYPKI